MQVPMREETAREQKRLFNEKQHNLYASSCIITVLNEIGGLRNKLMESEMHTKFQS